MIFALKIKSPINFLSDSFKSLMVDICFFGITIIWTGAFGSISLKGATIDDLTFKNYKVNLDEEKKVTLLGPRNITEGYLIESGFVTSDKNVETPIVC